MMATITLRGSDPHTRTDYVFALHEDGTTSLVSEETLPQYRFEDFNRYLHVDNIDSAPEPTDAQRDTIAGWFFDRPNHPIPGGCFFGGTLSRWAFAGKSPWDVGMQYGYDVPLLAGVLS